MPDNKDIILEELYSQHLKIIDGVKFSRRQIDVIACIVSGWGVKSTAARLSIASSTVETHIDTIVQKLGSGGRNIIISFIEQSGKDKQIRLYYQQLISDNKFAISEPTALEPNQKATRSHRFKFAVVSTAVLGFICIGLFYVKVEDRFFEQKKQTVSVRSDLPIPHKSTQQTTSSTQSISPLTWNLPNIVDHYTERKELTEIIWSKLTGQNQRNTTILAGLHGLGGIGKTTLAINAIHNPRYFYEFRGWFSAETKDLLKADYLELGERFHLFSDDMSDKLKIKTVKEWLDSKESFLLVYDNAPDMETLNDYLPNKGDIIITSRNYKIPGAIEVDVMTETEALHLLHKLIPTRLQQTTSYQKQVKRLINELGHLPLALSQAGSYINESMLTLSNYLRLYETNREKLLSEKSLPPGDQHEPVYISWNINIEEIQNLPQGDKAIDLLNFISYCNPENIPRKLLIQYLYGNTTNDAEILFNKALKLLRRYSLIKVSPNSISIHRLVHDWVKTKHTKANKLVVLQKGMVAIKAIYPEENKTAQEMEFVKYLISHAESILSQIRQLVTDVETVDLVSLLGDSYEVLGDYDKSKKFFERALTINEKYFGTSHIKTAKSIDRVGVSHHRLGNYTKAKQLLEKALIINEKHYGSSHVETAKVLRKLSWTHFRLCNTVVAEKMSEKALVIIKKYYGSNHVETAKFLRNLSWAYVRLGNYVVAKQMAEQALIIYEKQFGPDHIETAKSLHNRVFSFLTYRNCSKTKQILEKALVIYKKHYGPKHLRVASILNTIAMSYGYSGDYIESKNIFKKSSNIVNKHYGNNHFFNHIIKSNLGNTYRLLKKHSKGKKLLEESLEYFSRFYGPDNMYTAIIIGNLGLLYGDLGDNANKRECLEKALIIFKRYLYPEHLYIIQTLDELQRMDASIAEKKGNKYKSVGYFFIMR